jgi:LysM repeat protein
MEKWEKNVSPKFINDKPENKEHLRNGKEDLFLSRRKFLGMLGRAVVGGSLLTGGGMLGRMFLERDKRGKKKDDVMGEQNPTEEQIEIEKKEKMIIGQTLEEQIIKNGRVKLTRETKKAIYQKWRESYSPPAGENYPGLIEAMNKLSVWKEDLENVFRQEGVPKEYVFLAIPESHFDITAVSRKYAAGPYQFTSESAKLFGLSLGSVFDERYDPIKSGRACARHLKYSFEKFNHDWSLALADYNGGFTNLYAEFRPHKEDRNYDDYLAWREKRINDYINEKKFKHKVARGETLWGIAGKYKMSIDEIKRINGKRDNKIKAGEILKINKKIEKVIGSDLRDSLENLNYPEKFFAVLDVIRENNLEEKIQKRSVNYITIEISKTVSKSAEYEVEKGDTLYGIARMIKSDYPSLELSLGEIVKKIKKENSHLKKNIQPRDKIRFNLPDKKMPSLENIAIQKGIPPETLIELNPAVIDWRSSLPAGIEIRLPKK